MNKKLFAIPLCALFVASAACLSACGPKDNGGNDDDNNGGNETVEYGLKPTEAVTLPDEGVRTTDGVFVHDPSVFQDPKDGTYYVFGSHYAIAKSSDLITWEQVNSDYDAKTNPKADEFLFDGGVTTAMPETMTLAARNKDAWAPDVEYHDGKYYMYISFTTAMYTSTSVISRVESDNVLGPYSNETILLESVTPSESTAKPNCIDPELFHDKDGGLWMVYGSFFGGIYVKELYNEGENWGLPKEEGLNNWGKRIWKDGYSEGVEGPYVFYNEKADYYYLMVSEANLMNNYNMRFARSKNPDGPYEDITENDVATAAGKGNKVAGNYKFARQSVTQGYAALGHNSVIKDKDGKYFVLYHARRQSANTVTPGHNLCVSQLFFNEELWPVMSPVCYEGETFGTVTQADVANTYEVVIHSKESVVTLVNSEDYELTSDGKVTKGATEVGEWSIKDGYYVTLTISNMEYNGVVVPGWDMYKIPASQREGVLCITAVSNEGVSLWAIAK